MNIEQERAEFEAWYRRQYIDSEPLIWVESVQAYREFDHNQIFGAYQAGRAALQSQDREDAVEVMEILDTGEWSLVRSIPGEWPTDEANNEHRWCVQRQLPPYCGKDGVHYWTGPTAISALRAGMKAIDHARRVKGGAMNINIIDKDAISVDGSLFERVEGEETLICTLDGYQYFLGPEYDDELGWDDAKKWCESLGEGYELPSRLVMLAICMNEATAALLTEDEYWTSAEFEYDASQAWLQQWHSGSPGLQGYASKSHLYRVRAVRRCRIEGDK